MARGSLIRIGTLLLWSGRAERIWESMRAAQQGDPMDAEYPRLDRETGVTSEVPERLCPAASTTRDRHVHLSSICALFASLDN